MTVSSRKRKVACSRDDQQEAAHAWLIGFLWLVVRNASSHAVGQASTIGLVQHSFLAMARSKSSPAGNPSYAELQKQIAALQSQAEQAREQEVSDVIARIKEAIQVYNLSPDELFPQARSQKPKQPKDTVRGKSVAKYRDPVSGKTWTGNGKRPGWFVAAIEGGASLQSLSV